MNKIICSIQDSKAAAWLPPLFFSAKGAAVRAFSDAVNKGDGEIAKHPGDYTLYKIGEFDEQTGEITGCVAELLGNGSNFVTGDE